MKILLLSCVVLISGCVTTPETGRSAFIMTSEGQEMQMGEQAYQETLAKEKLSTNERWNAILQRVGSRIATSANKPDYKWEFKLIESTTANAFCLPGGKVAVYTGILSKCQNEAGLATVLGHEVAHATARHGGQRISTALGAQLGLTAVNALIGGKDSTSKDLLMAALGLGANVGVMLPFSRSNESEADEIGLIYMARAGYDPREAPRFWDRFGSDGGGMPAFLSTHPKSSDRKRSLEGQIPKAISLYEKSNKYGLGEKL